MASASGRKRPGNFCWPGYTRRRLPASCRTGTTTTTITTRRGYPPQQCGPVTAHWLQIYPPNQTAPVYLHYTSPACTKPVKLLTVNVVVPGSGG